jgi:hypothetical protein
LFVTLQILLFLSLKVIKGNIRVFVRVRPPSSVGAAVAVRPTSTGDILVAEGAAAGTDGAGSGGAAAAAAAPPPPGTKAPPAPRVFEFDHVFGTTSTQDQVHEISERGEGGVARKHEEKMRIGI